jgi:hypothetical protein
MNLEMYDNKHWHDQAVKDQLLYLDVFVAKRIESKPHPQDPRCLDFMAE